jgi:hydroxymethylbilane synthase
LFTKELEVDLRKGKTDLAVHSLKDLPTDSPAGLIVAAVLEREDPRDALVLNRGIMGQSLDDLPRGSRVGTSSLRRRAQCCACAPISRSPSCVATCRRGSGRWTRAACTRRSSRGRDCTGWRAPAHHLLPRCAAWLPAAGQGRSPYRTRDDDDRHPRHRRIAQRRCRRCAPCAPNVPFLQALEGGCQVPIGALAVPTEVARCLHGMIADVSGTRVVRGTIAWTSPSRS